jgi:repressor LexA
MNGLTTRQRTILAFLRRFIRDHGYPPTIREIRDAFGLKSNRGVVDHLKALERKGYIRRLPGGSRAIGIERDPEEEGGPAGRSRGTVVYPVAGSVPAGRPEIPGGETGRSLVLDESLFGGRGDFILEVKGDSMTGDHIVSGDLIVVRKADRCEPGSLVVALVDGEATVKRYVRSGSHVILEPANPAYAPIVFGDEDSRDCVILGTVVGVIRAIAPGKRAFSG